MISEARLTANRVNLTKGRAALRQQGNNRRPSKVRLLSAEEAAWLGGLFEGEGWLVKNWWANHKKNTDYQPYLGLGSTDVETISTVLRLVGDGKVVKQSDSVGLGSKPIWRYYLAALNPIRDLLFQLRPYLTGKRLLADEFIEEITRRQHNVT